MNYGEMQVVKDLQEAKFMIKQTASYLEKALSNENCKDKDRLYLLLVRTNRLHKDIIDVSTLNYE